MSKLHELLAVENNLSAQAAKLTEELRTVTFEKKRHHFAEKRVTFQPLDENAKAVTESQSDIQTSVRQEISWLNETLEKALDVSHQIDIANTKAFADVVTEDGKTLLTAVPATSLLALEKQIERVRGLIAGIPTLDPAMGFRLDEDRPDGAYKAREVTKTRTRKTKEVVVLYQATDKHPAQTALVDTDAPTGTIIEQEWSTLITPVTKSDLLARADKLLRAIKRARSKANEVDLDVQQHRVGKALLNYVFEPLKEEAA